MPASRGAVGSCSTTVIGQGKQGHTPTSGGAFLQGASHGSLQHFSPG